MKRVLFTISLLLGLCVMFSSCEKNDTAPNNDDYILGCWVDLYDGNKVWEYEEYTADGIWKNYYLKPEDDDIYATYNNGVVSLPAGAKWVLDDYCSYSFSYSSGLYVINGYGYTTTIIDKDTFIIHTKYDDETFHRIKKFK